MSNLKRYDGSNWQPIEIDADKLGGKAPSSFQDKLVSGTNIKTINGNSVLGSGNISVSGTDSSKLPLSGGTLTGDLKISDGNKIVFQGGAYYGLSGLYVTEVSVNLGSYENNEASTTFSMPSNSGSGSWYVIVQPSYTGCNTFICGVQNPDGGYPTNGGKCTIWFRRLFNNGGNPCKAKVIMLKIW